MTAWVSMVLSMIGRPCIEGYVPLFAITANVCGAGKSLLVDAASLIAYGHRAARKASARNDDEMRKAITAIAIGAVPSVLPIRLQSPLETPEDRTGFEHSDLLSWIESQRPSFAVAALTILRAYFVAGCPVQPDGDWGSFESWSAKIRGAIVWAGGADPLPTRATALAGDDTAALLYKLITGIEEADSVGVGLTTKEIQRKTFGSQNDENYIDRPVDGQLGRVRTTCRHCGCFIGYRSTNRSTFSQRPGLAERRIS